MHGLLVGHVDVIDRHAQRCARCFLWIALPTMLLLSLLVGPFGASDEPAHFLRAVALSRGEVLPLVSRTDMAANPAHESAGAMVDANVARYALALDFEHLSKATRKMSISLLRQDLHVRSAGRDVYARHSNTAIYPPLLYPAPVLAVLVSRAVDAPILLWLYAGRVANVLIGSAISWWAIRQGRDSAPFLLVAATLPLTLFETATVAADALLLPIMLLFGSMLVRLSTRQLRSTRDTILLAGATLIVASGKVAYLPLAILPPVAARLADRHWSRNALILAAASLFSVAFWAGWAWLISDKVFSIRWDTVTDPHAQLAQMLASPIASIRLIASAARSQLPYLLPDAVGYRIGWFDIALPYPLAIAAQAMLVISSVTAVHPVGRLAPLTFGAVALALLCYLGIFVLIYLQFNAVGVHDVYGVQGRYLTPLIILILCLTPRPSLPRAWSGRMSYLIMTWCALSVISTLYVVTNRFWS